VYVSLLDIIELTEKMSGVSSVEDTPSGTPPVLTIVVH
jgi:hypothetical protein